MSYSPNSIPNEVKFLPDFLRDELNRIAEEMSSIKDIRLDVLHVAPSKPRNGDVVLADGTDWDPGSGAGFYGYRGGVYVFLG